VDIAKPLLDIPEIANAAVFFSCLMLRYAHEKNTIDIQIRADII
jgi:hypothetical protein